MDLKTYLTPEGDRFGMRKNSAVSIGDLYSICALRKQSSRLHRCLLSTNISTIPPVYRVAEVPSVDFDLSFRLPPISGTVLHEGFELLLDMVYNIE